GELGRRAKTARRDAAHEPLPPRAPAVNLGRARSVDPSGAHAASPAPGPPAHRRARHQRRPAAPRLSLLPRAVDRPARPTADPRRARRVRAAELRSRRLDREPARRPRLRRAPAPDLHGPVAARGRPVVSVRAERADAAPARSARPRRADLRLSPAWPAPRRR